MTVSSCDGSFVPEDVARVLDKTAHQYRSFPGHYNPSYEVRAADARRQRKADEETRVVRALMMLAARTGTVETAAVGGVADRAAEGDGDSAEAARIAREHGFDTGRLIAMRSLARARAVPLETVLRAALRGDLRRIVELPSRPSGGDTAS
jgi:hypothetical protein